MSVLEAAIGWLAPPDCLVCGSEGAVLCASCSTSEIKPFGEHCWRCNCLSPCSQTCTKCRLIGPLSYVWISTNYEGQAQQIVRRYKFGHLRSVADSLARIMAHSLPEQLGANFMVVPLPTATSRARERERGFGHSELLAKKNRG